MGAVSSIFLAVVIVALAPLLEFLPNACLAAIVIVNLKGLLFQIKNFWYYYRVSLMEAVSCLNRYKNLTSFTIFLLSYYRYFG
jgi:MFS superfamily sulfate permease-like transporter